MIALPARRTGSPVSVAAGAPVVEVKGRERLAVCDALLEACFPPRRRRELHPDAMCQETGARPGTMRTSWRCQHTPSNKRARSSGTKAGRLSTSKLTTLARCCCCGSVRGQRPLGVPRELVGTGPPGAAPRGAISRGRSVLTRSSPRDVTCFIPVSSFTPPRSMARRDRKVLAPAPTRGSSYRTTGGASGDIRPSLVHGAGCGEARRGALPDGTRRRAAERVLHGCGERQSFHAASDSAPNSTATATRPHIISRDVGVQAQARQGGVGRVGGGKPAARTELGGRARLHVLAHAEPLP
jgi:hypothetical protein